MLKVWMEKSLYAHTNNENGEDTVEKKAQARYFRDRDVHKVMKSPRHSSRCSGVNPRSFIHLRGLSCHIEESLYVELQPAQSGAIPKSCPFFG
jgi:hypothetical protein